ncbi:hypothetical protein DFJ74DRAFT_686405 [Hyaloraphidium curvatum]|nr:hypothetical protein DFJ74DRAFT_686405 [Hyaloraphidium curvatum]
MTATEIPIVDLALRDSASPADREAFARALDRGLFDTGFFLLKGAAGLDQAFIDRLISTVHGFFDLPQQVKDRYSVLKYPNWRGYVKLGEETTHYAVNYRENYDFGFDRPAFDPKDESVPLVKRMLNGPNVWPDEALVPGFRSTVEEWGKIAHGINLAVLHLVAERLGAPGEDPARFDKWFSLDGPEDPWFLLKLSHYPPTKEVPIATAEELSGNASWAQGLGAHTDTGFFSVLVQDKPGLQVQLHSGEWIDVPVVPGTAVVNFGRLLADLTHGALEATTHRVNAVVVPERRVSVPYFFVPTAGLPELVSAERARKIVAEHLGVSEAELAEGRKIKHVVTDVDPDWDGDNLESFEDRIILNRVRQYPGIAKRFWPEQYRRFGMHSEAAEAIAASV